MAINENDANETDSESGTAVNVKIPKYTRFIIFMVFVFLVLNAIYEISNFFNVESSSTYTYFIWFSLLLFLFVILPIKRSVFS